MPADEAVAAAPVAGGSSADAAASPESRGDSDAEAAIAMCSVKAADPRAESVKHEDFWA